MKADRKANRKLGQNFLVCADVAKKEAAFAEHRDVIEIGPGRGMLTKELCAKAEHVLAVEIDSRLYNALESSMHGHENLKLVNADFFSLKNEDLEGYGMLIANIPYKLSSKTIEWVLDTGIESVLCVQKEFALRMLAKPSTKEYSKLSVMSQLFLDIEMISKVPRTCFSPRPKVDSAIIHIKRNKISATEEELHIISALMMHKKKRLYNAVMDSRKELSLAKDLSIEIARALGGSDRRVFKMAPSELLETSRELEKRIARKN